MSTFILFSEIRSCSVSVLFALFISVLGVSLVLFGRRLFFVLGFCYFVLCGGGNTNGGCGRVSLSRLVRRWRDGRVVVAPAMQ
jgi:hypothetical protein